MDPPDDDIQFDFFEDEPVTAEAAAPARRGIPQRTPRLPRVAVGGPHSTKPLMTLGAIVFIGIFVLLFFAVLISSCGSSRHSQYSNYMGKVGTIAAQSTNDGKQTVKALTTPGLSVTAIVGKLNNIAAEEQQNVQAATNLSTPGRLRPERLHLIEALQLRVSGVSGLATEFRNTLTSKDKDTVEAGILSGQAYRLLASDIVWADLFEKPALDQIAHDGVSQVTVPSSAFLSQPDSFVTPAAMLLVLQRIAGNTGTKGSPPTGLHGTNIDSVSALPDGVGGREETLSPNPTLNTVETSSSLVFKVTITDGGDSQEVGIPVTLTIQRAQSAGGPIIRTETIQLIDPNSNASVTFANLGNVTFDTKTTITVDVKGVPGEATLDNNHAQYEVLFSLPS
ncbi:MAG TPA: hypothetical protein VGM80_02150 [Gaiellaceae bacterium]